MELSAYSQDGNVMLYFMLPQGSGSDDCSKLLRYASQACKEHDLEPQWLKTEECLKLNPTKQDVFVCDPFEGEAYNYLVSGGLKCVRILGPRCLLTCLHSKKPVPELPSPLHNMAMHEIVVTSTGYEKEEKNDLQHLVEKMCGIYSNSFHEGITHLIAKAVGTKKYQVATEKETPIMTEEWVKAVWKASSDETCENVSATQSQFTKFTCPVFRGLVICVSQLPRKEKDALKIVIENNGGVYAANLEMSTTSVLITSSAEGDKYKHASQWRIPCLSQDWIQDSVENGFALPWDEYKVVKKPQSSTPTNDNSIKVPPDVSICSTIMNESTITGTLNINETIDQDQSLFLKKQTDPKISAGIKALEDLDLVVVHKAGLFLDGCKIFISGFDSSVSEKLRRILNAGGATRFNNLTDAVTHVIVGKHITEHLNAIQSWTVKPQIVTADWLVECVRECRVVDEQTFLYLKSSEFGNNVSVLAHRKSPININQIENRGNEITMNDETIIDHELLNQYLSKEESRANTSNLPDNSVDCSTLPDSQVSSNSGIFRGQVFTVSGYSNEIEEQLMEIICENGGTVVDQNSILSVNYSIVSVEGEGEFTPKALNYVTHLYLEECLEQEVLLPVQYFHLPFLWPTNSEILSDCVVTVSAYKGKERPFISHVVTKLGATYQDLFAKKNNASKGVKSSTHLLCPLPEGGKYAAAQKWGVHAITKDWLLKCAAEGYRVAEDDFSVDEADREVDCKAVLISLLRKGGKLHDGCSVLKESLANHSLLSETPINRNVKSLKMKNDDWAASIQTPDQETIRKMYPTPGNEPKNDSLDNLPTPDTPYGSTWYSNPPARVRKAYKRALDAIPDDPPKRPFISPGTPYDVLFQRYSQKVKDFIASQPPPKFPPCDTPSPAAKPNEKNQRNDSLADKSLRDQSKLEEETGMEENITTSNDKPADHHGPLSGVVVYASKKLSDVVQELYRTVSDLGGNYRWLYDDSITHLIHNGRLNDTNKEFRVARDQGKIIVAPDWVWMCRDEGAHIDESLFPHTHNPKLSLSIISTKCTPHRKTKRGRSRKSDKEDMNEVEETNPIDELEGEEQCTSVSSPPTASKEVLAKQLEELETLASVNGTVQKRTPSFSSRSKTLKNTPTILPPNTQAPSNTETESQGTAITWDDPLDREARARLEVALVGDTQDIIAQQKQNAEEGTSFQPTASQYVFAISGMTDEEREEYATIVHTLNGTVVDSKTLDSTITHIVSVRPTRSEKHLAAIASGKWIVFKSFLNCSRDQGHFVKEEDHEWGNSRALSLPPLPKGSTEALLASAAHRWRVKMNETGVGAFYGMKVAVYSSRERAAAFTRLVEAGGGQVITEPELNLNEITHCFVELSRAPKVDVALFASKGIPCLPPLYLNELIIMHPPPDETECCIPEYKDIIINMTACEKNLLRTKNKWKDTTIN